MLHLIPASVDVWLTVVGAAAYAVYGVRMWPSRGWRLRASYLAGGAVMGVYEVHMWWWIEAIGLALILVPIIKAPETGSGSGSATDGEPLRSGDGR